MSPRSPELNRRLREESRARIVDQALDLFARHGYEATSVRMIAQAAGVAQGLMYNYFRGKDELLRAVIEQGMGDVAASFAEAEAAGSPVLRLERLVHASLETVRRNLRFWKLSYALRMQGPVLGGVGGEIRAAATVIRGTLEGYLRDAGVDRPEIEAALLFALIDGVAQHYALDPEHYPLEEAKAGIVRHLHRLVGHGAGPGGEPRRSEP